MRSAILTGIYTLTPTHCGTGQTSGAIDLPIARETHTGLPVLPASGMKGAARSTLNEKDPDEKALAQRLFGATISASGEAEGAAAGSLVVLEGRLLLYPFRSLQRPFLYATCPMILERLARDLRALGLDPLLGTGWTLPALPSSGGDNGTRALVINAELAGKTLVVEDMVYKKTEVGALVQGTSLSNLSQTLLPQGEKDTIERIKQNLVVLDDSDFMDLVRRAVPVQARIHLDDATKTTSGNDGNLWYEETLPPDCLFTLLATERVGTRRNGGNSVEEFKVLLAKKKSLQIGGNETVGQGFCWWTAGASTSPKGGNRGEA